MMRHPTGQIDPLNEYAVFSAFERCFLDAFAGPLEFLLWSLQMFALLTNFALNILLLPLLQDLSIVPANCSSKVSAALFGPMKTKPALAIP
jgi:hypothetical protein